MTAFIFWFSILFVIYTYLMYPVILYLLTYFQQKNLIVENLDLSCNKTISIIISAKNEGSVLEERIKNLSQQDYDSSLIEMIIVSDGSTDNTEFIVRNIIDKNIIKMEIKLISLTESEGKPNALNLAVSVAKGEILIFADCRQKFEKDAFKYLVSYFTETSIGAVSGELVFRASNDSSIQMQVGMYWMYEKFIRKLESNIGSTIGVTGAIYAMRRSLYTPLNKCTLIDDVVIPIGILSKNYKVIFSQSAIAYDYVSKNEKHEWRRKVRTLAGNWQLLNKDISQLFGLRCLQLFMVFSHKLFRVFVPFFLIIILILSLLIDGDIYKFIFIMQFIVYFSVLVSHFVPTIKKYKIINLAYFFVLLNIAALAGFIFWITGNTDQLWKSGRINNEKI